MNVADAGGGADNQSKSRGLRGRPKIEAGAVLTPGRFYTKLAAFSDDRLTSLLEPYSQDAQQD